MDGRHVMPEPTKVALSYAKEELSFVNWENNYTPNNNIVSVLMSQAQAEEALAKILKKESDTDEKAITRAAFFIKQSNQDTTQYRLCSSTEKLNKLIFMKTIRDFLNKVHAFEPCKWRLFISTSNPTIEEKVRIRYTTSPYFIAEDNTAKFLDFSEDKFPGLSKEIKDKLCVEKIKYVCHYQLLDTSLLAKLFRLATKEDLTETLSIKP